MRARFVGSVFALAAALLPWAPVRASSTWEFDVAGTGEYAPCCHLPRGVYTVKAFGRIQYSNGGGGPAYADAECTTPNGSVTLDDIAMQNHLYPSPVSGWQSHRFVVQGGGTDLLDLEVDGIAPEWVPLFPTPIGYDPLNGGPGVDVGCNEADNTYQYVLTSIDADHQFRVYDPNASDNVGSIHVVITQVG